MSFRGYKRSGFTLMEIAISVLIVAIITLVTVPVIRGQLKRSDEYSYYLAFRTVEKLGGQIAALGDPDYAKTSKIPSKINLALLPAAKLQKKYDIQGNSHPFISKLSKNLASAELKIFKILFPKAYADYTVDAKLFDSDKISDIYKYSVVCVNGSADVYYSETDLSTKTTEEYSALTDEEKTNYFTQSSYCNTGNSTMSKQEQYDNYLLSLLSNESCFKQSTICTTVDEDSTCETKIRNKRAAALSELKSSIINGTQYICSNIVEKYCDGSASYEETTESTQNVSDDDDDGINAETIGLCILKTTVHEEPIVASSSQSWYPSAAPTCESLGYVNTENKAAASSTAWVGSNLYSNQKIYNDCQCKDGYSWSENNSKVCCENSSGLSYYIGDGKCTSCQTDFNPQKKSCCLNYSTYNSSTGKCECIMGYSGDGDDSNIGCTRSSCPPGMLLDEDAKVCVPAPPLISAKRFCELIVANWNTSSYSCSTFSGSPSKYDSVYNAAYKENVLNSIKGASGAFNSIAPNIVFSNGLKLWILGDRAASIPGLSYDSSNAASTQNMCIDLKKATAEACTDAGGYFCSSEYHCMKLDGTSTLSDARNCCSSAIAVEEDADPKNMALSGFTVYVDINGSKGNGTLWEDVFPFYVTTAGRVYPAYPLDGAEAHVGGNNSAYLSADVYYYKASSNFRKRVLAFSEISYADAVCKAGVINPNSPYCLNLGSVATGDNPCTRIGADDATTKCFVSIRKKAKFL